MSLGADNYLVFAFCRLGDTLVMLPALHLLRSSRPRARITLLSQAASAPGIVDARQLLGGTGLVDAFIDYPATGGHRHLKALLLALSLRGRFTTAFILMPPAPPLNMRMLRRMRLFLRFCGIREIWAPGAILNAPAPFAADSILQILRPGFEIPAPGTGDCSLPPSGDEAIAVEAEAIVHSFPPHTIPVAVATGASMPSKKWPLERYAQSLKVLAKDRFHPVLFGGLQDKGDADAIAGVMPVTQVIGKPIHLVAAVMRHCAFYIGNDTGLMHLAVACGLKCAAIFSARGIPRIWYPYGSGHRVLIRHTPCEGCNLIRCNVPGHPCLLSTQPDELIAAARQLASSAQTPRAYSGI